MIFTIFSVFYVLIAAAMIVLILMQRGDGANAGASFGGGSSGTVFGARGAASFLTRTTGVLAGVFFILTLGMGMYLSHHGVAPSAKQTLGVMAGAAPAASAPAATSAPAASAPAASIPAQQPEIPVAPTSAPAANAAVPAANPAIPTVPAKASAPASSAPASSAPTASH